jgi:IclR family KDG regulon transcriptional repressor
VILQVRVGIERIRLVAFESPESIRYTAGKGSVAPVYSGSAGKVLLSELKEDEFLSLIEKIQLVSVGPNTITDKKELIREVEKVRRQGYSVSIGEIVGGGAAISVPVRNYICPVALSLVGPDNRFSVDEMMRVLKEMKKSAKRISKKLQQFGPGKKKASML